MAQLQFVFGNPIRRPASGRTPKSPYSKARFAPPRRTNPSYWEESRGAAQRLLEKESRGRKRTAGVKQSAPGRSPSYWAESRGAAQKLLEKEKLKRKRAAGAKKRKLGSVYSKLKSIKAKRQKVAKVAKKAAKAMKRVARAKTALKSSFPRVKTYAKRANPMRKKTTRRRNPIPTDVAGSQSVAQRVLRAESRKKKRTKLTVAEKKAREKARFAERAAKRGMTPEYYKYMLAAKKRKKTLAAKKGKKRKKTRTKPFGIFSDKETKVAKKKKKAAKKSTRKTTKRKTHRKTTRRKTTHRKTAHRKTRHTRRKVGVRRTRRKVRHYKRASAKKVIRVRVPRKTALRLPGGIGLTHKHMRGEKKIRVRRHQKVRVGKGRRGYTIRRNPNPMYGGNIVERTLGLDMLNIGAILLAGGSFAAINGLLGKIPGVNSLKAALDNNQVTRGFSSSLLPLTLGVLLRKYMPNNKYADAFGNALIITSLSGIGVNTLAPIINKTAGGVAGLAGVDFTPYGEIPEGISGVDFTPYAGIPEGLSGADFGEEYGEDEGYEYGEEMDGADFGEETDGEEMYGADFGEELEMGGVDFTPYAGIPEGLSAIPEGYSGDEMGEELGIYSQAQMG